jgi:NAD(P)-dependent dehydrogenase (short-subunit alcohol dehydrogenase family)
VPAVSYPVSGKVALVTGAQRGIGWETARLLHSRDASVALVDLDEDLAKEAAERIAGVGRVIGIGADVTDRGARGGGLSGRCCGGSSIPSSMPAPSETRASGRPSRWATIPSARASRRARLLPHPEPAV